MNPRGETPWRRLAAVHWPLALILLTTVVVYLPSLAGPLLGYDDDWLVTRNTILHDPSLGALGRIWLDLSRPTRLVLGAEYLPLRDTNLWLEARLWGLDPGPLRLSQLALYLGAVTALRAALHRAWPAPIAVELATALFALHPVHAESVAWIASRKDVLALLFVALSLRAYVAERRALRWLAPVAIGLACLSKSMSVAAPALLPTLDLLARRRPDWRVLAASVAVAALSLWPHLTVGATMHMVAPPLGGSRLTAALSMGPVWLRYLGLLLYPASLSIVHEVAPLTHLTAASAAGWALLGLWAATGAALWWRRDRPLALVTFVWFAAPLAPVSQIAFPLQNAMADRYAFLSVTALGIAVGAGVNAAVSQLRADWRRAAVLAAALAMGAPASRAAERAALFADEVALFTDAMAKAPGSCVPPYQIGVHRLEHGDVPGAITALEAALARCAPPAETARRATTNLARALVAAGRLADAERVLRAGRAAWPDDPKQLANLMRVVARRGGHAEARSLFDELRRRFPTYLDERGRIPVGP